MKPTNLEDWVHNNFDKSWERCNNCDFDGTNLCDEKCFFVDWLFYPKEQIDALVAELQKTRERLDIERQGQSFGGPLKLFRNGQINMIDWLLNELGAKESKT